MKSARLLLGWVLLALAVGWSQVGLSQGESLASVGERSNPAAQTIVEAMRSATGAEMALLGAAFFNESAAVPATGFTADDLIKSLAHPDDEVVVLSLRGEQILQALERALELYPQKNNAFLQVAGAEARFNPKAEPGKRVRQRGDCGREAGARARLQGGDHRADGARRAGLLPRLEPRANHAKHGAHCRRCRERLPPVAALHAQSACVESVR
jgi:hypothetical protein